MSIRKLSVLVLLAMIGNGLNGQAIQVWLAVDTVYVDEYVGTLQTIDAGSVVYQMYVEMTHPDDIISTIYGDTINPMILETSTNFLINESFGLLPSSTNIEILKPIAPDIAAVSYLTISGQSQICIDSEPMVLSSIYHDWMSDMLDGQSAFVNDAIGGGWSMDPYQTALCSGAGEDLLISIGQFTTNGVFSGVINVQTFIHGIHADYSLDLGLEFGPDNIAVFGCTDSSFANYNPLADFDDGSCLFWGDLNGDGEVNISDVLEFMTMFGCYEDCGFSDMNGDGIVNAQDLLILLSNL